MPDYGGSLLALIDARIDAAQPRITKMGTVQQRDTTGARATVSFDGSSGAGQPVKCVEGVVVDLGDRVCLAKFEGDWIVIGNYTLRSWGAQTISLMMGSSSTTTSSSFVDAPTSPSAAIVKYRDATYIEVHVGISMWTTAAPTVVEIGININPVSGSFSSFDTAVFHRALNAASDHRDMSGSVVVQASVPADGYTLTARWRRVSGTGTLTMDLNDGVTIVAKEVLP